MEQFGAKIIKTRINFRDFTLFHFFSKCSHLQEINLMFLIMWNVMARGSGFTKYLYIISAEVF